MAKTKLTPFNGNGKAIPPPDSFVQIYFDQKGASQAEATAFLQCYTANHWTTPTGKKILDWKATANNWIWSRKQQEQLQRKQRLQVQQKHLL